MSAENVSKSLIITTSNVFDWQALLKTSHDTIYVNAQFLVNHCCLRNNTNIPFHHFSYSSLIRIASGFIYLERATQYIIVNASITYHYAVNSAI